MNLIECSYANGDTNILGSRSSNHKKEAVSSEALKSPTALSRKVIYMVTMINQLKIPFQIQRIRKINKVCGSRTT